MNCKKCFEVFVPSKGLTNYCSLKCRNSRSFTTETNLKRKEKTLQHWNEGKIYKRGEIKKIVCLNCNNEFETKRKRIYCSLKCRNTSEELKMSGRKGGLNSSLKRTKRSVNEIYFFQLCKERFKNVLNNVPMFNGWDADIILPDLKIAILWNGKWHYEKITEQHSLEQVQNRDKIKQKEIENCGYIPYIVKDMGSRNKKFVEEQFLIFTDIVQW